MEMLSSGILATAAICFCMLQCKCIKNDRTKFEHDGRKKENENNCSYVHSGSTRVGDKSGKNYNYDKEPYYHEHDMRVIRSDNAAAANGSGVERPNSRLITNKAVTYRKALEQVHVFFSDKAREDAYQKTEAKEHPYSVVYLVHTKRGGVTVCSGTLMTARLVLTAAHCLVDYPTERIEVFAGITINIFSAAIPNPLPEGSQMRTSKTFYSHPKYDPIAPNVDYDIAIIRTDPEFELTEYVKPVEISPTPWNHTGARRCALTAFGSVRDDSNKSPDDFIRKTQILEVEKPCYCDVKLRRSLGIGATSRYICMRPKQDFGICSGDSGGGIICDDKLTAVVSISVLLDPYYPCKRHVPEFEENLTPECGGKNTLSIFQDVYQYFSWIKKSAAYSESDIYSGATSQIINLNSGLNIFTVSLLTLLGYLNII